MSRLQVEDAMLPLGQDVIDATHALRRHAGGLQLLFSLRRAPRLCPSLDVAVDFIVVTHPARHIFEARILGALRTMDDLRQRAPLRIARDGYHRPLILPRTGITTLRRRTA